MEKVLLQGQGKVLDIIDNQIKQTTGLRQPYSQQFKVYFFISKNTVFSSRLFARPRIENRTSPRRSPENLHQKESLWALCTSWEQRLSPELGQWPCLSVHVSRVFFLSESFVKGMPRCRQRITYSQKVQRLKPRQSMNRHSPETKLIQVWAKAPDHEVFLEQTEHLRHTVW